MTSPVNEAHPVFAIYKPLSSEFDFSMATIPSIEMDLSKATPQILFAWTLRHLPPEGVESRVMEVVAGKWLHFLIGYVVV